MSVADPGWTVSPNFRDHRLFGTLTVNVVRVYDCRRACKIGDNNLQVVITCDGDKRSTRTIEDAGAAAVFNETLTFPLDCETSDLVHIKVKHDSHFIDAVVGIFSLTLAEFIGETQGKRLKLQIVHPETFKPAGMIELMCEYEGTNDPMPESSHTSRNASGANSPHNAANQAPMPVAGSSTPGSPSRPGAANGVATQMPTQQQQPQPLTWSPPVNVSGPVLSGPVLPGAVPVYGSSVSYSNRAGPQMMGSTPVWTVANAATTFLGYGPHGSPHWGPAGPQRQFFPQNGSNAPFLGSQPMPQQPQFAPPQQPQTYGSMQQQQTQRPWQSPYASQSPAAAASATSASSLSAAPPSSAVPAPSIPIFTPPPLPPTAANGASDQQAPLLSSVRKYEPPPMLSQPALPSPAAAASVVAASAAAANYASPQSSPPATAPAAVASPSPLFSPMGGAFGRDWHPHATPRAGTAGPDSRPFDQLLQLKKRGDARVCLLRVWADECVHGLQFCYESPEEGAPIIEGELAGVQLSSTGRPEVIRLDPGNSITAVGGRFNPNGVLEVLLIGTRRGAQRSFGGLGASPPAGREFVLRIPAGHRVCGWFGSENLEGFTSLGAYTGMARSIHSKSKLDLPD